MEVITTKLSNGLTIATQNMLEVESVTAGLWVKSGSRNEDAEEHGLAHMLEHMAFKGTKTRSAKQIVQEIEDVGGEINAATSVEITGYFSRILKKDTELAVDIISDIISNSVFDEEELTKEKQVVLQEIGSNYDSPSDIVFDYFMDVAYKDQAIGRPILGTSKSVLSFKQSDFTRFMKQHYYAKHMVFSAAGNVDHDEFVKYVEKRLSHIPEKQEDPSFKKTIYVGGRKVEVRDLMDSQILIGFEGCNYQGDDFYQAQLLAIILGGGMSSRLFQNIREKLGICYSIYSFHWGFSDTGIFGISASTNKDSLNVLIPAIVDELKLLLENLTEEEVKRAIAQYQSSLIISNESSSSRAPTIARQLLTRGRVISNYEVIEYIKSVDVKDLKELGAQLFFNSRPSLAAVGPVGDVLSQQDLCDLFIS